jgi:hypothetical protein
VADDADVIGFSGGVPVTDELVERFVEEAERGYDPEMFKIRDGPRTVGAMTTARPRGEPAHHQSQSP